MPKLPRTTAKKLLPALKRAGFYVDHITGSHYILYKDNNSPAITVPYHNKIIKLGTLSSIMKQAGLTAQELINFL